MPRTSLSSSSVPILAYHNIVQELSAIDEPETVSIDTLARHFAWLSAHGYTPIRPAQLLSAIKHGTPLPLKPIVLSFDDGYASFYQYVFPLLRAFNWPAQQALIGRVLDTGRGATPQIKGETYLNPDEIKELADSGLVEFANHSYDLHHGVASNAWGNLQPAAVTRTWTQTGEESDAQWELRVQRDLMRNQELITELTGQVPTTMVWPYGRYNGALQQIAASVGLRLLFTLDQGISDIGLDQFALKRFLIGRHDTEAALAQFLEPRSVPISTMRAVAADVARLATTYATPKEEVLSDALEQLTKVPGNTLMLNPFVKERGIITKATFATNVLPTDSQYANRVAVVIAGKTGYGVWLSMPLSPLHYRGLNESAILQLVEDAAKAMPLSGLMVEDADLVSTDLMREALRRVSLWRQTPFLGISIDMSLPSQQVDKVLRQSGAKYIMLKDGNRNGTFNEKTSPAQVIVAVKAPFSNAGLLGTPEDTNGALSNIKLVLGNESDRKLSGIPAQMHVESVQ
ncbi:MAG: polysaccharide deacetylase family protein [Agitococcus sp.]|nr:polysaccharide deacetylase family protein [Agitococcus sp.]